jgi:hypothetical protein
MLAAVYFAGVTAPQAIFRTLTGQEQQPQLAVVVSTLVIAALFTPPEAPHLVLHRSSLYDTVYQRGKEAPPPSPESYGVWQSAKRPIMNVHILKKDWV